jgi:cysteinyl-tRNA synthetase
MKLSIYNSLTNKIEEFIPYENNKVTMYVCGPTVYNKIHIGNARPVVFFDIVKKYLTYLGYEVTYASNITDVDDKIIDSAHKHNQDELSYAHHYADVFLKNVQELGCAIPDHVPYATNYMDQMIEFISELVRLGYAYEVDGDVYFRVGKLADYGALSKQKLEMLDTGVRIDVDSKKENPGDFSLWKKTEVGIKWDSPFGEGRPGWHTECVCMIDDIFHKPIDIHGGGFDLRFPHHENEIAQYKAAHGKDLSKYFMHVGRLNFNGEKMSKSLGNTVIVDDLGDKALAYRLFISMQNYRNQVNFTEELFESYVKDYDKIKRAYLQALFTLDLNNIETKEKDEEIIKEFISHMNDDFNTPNVYTLILGLVKDLNVSIRSKSYDLLAVKFNTLKEILDVFGFVFPYHKLTDDDRGIYALWQEARTNKDFEKADYYRNELSARGIL